MVACMYAVKFRSSREHTHKCTSINSGNCCPEDTCDKTDLYPSCTRMKLKTAVRSTPAWNRAAQRID
jgi:hypothetical protein